MKVLDEKTWEKMLARAFENQERAYVPYSNFRVGACLLSSNGNFFDGCNIENAAYGPSNCAERTAVFTAVCAGERSFDGLAITTSGDAPAFPCGVCRQVLNEFCEPDMPIVCADRHGNVARVTLKDLLPYSFGPKDLGK